MKLRSTSVGRIADHEVPSGPDVRFGSNRTARITWLYISAIVAQTPKETAHRKLDSTSVDDVTHHEAHNGDVVRRRSTRRWVGR
jgi:hypothetical protein